MKHEDYSTEELRERAELISNIVVGLRTINDDTNNLDALAEKVSNICSGLRVIADSEV